MPVLADDDYRPSLLFRQKHLNTIYPYLFRKTSGFKYGRITLDLPDGDFMHLDTVCSGNKRLIILLHGLEGNSESQYMRSNTKHFSKRQWDVVCMNHRSCSGVLNNKPYAYHSGWTEDLHHVIQHYEKAYDDIVLLGFSLGGNISLKYIGDGIYPLSDKLKAVVAVSAPIDLRGCSVCISSKENRVYQKNFLKTLKQKMKAKAPIYPDHFDKDRIDAIQSLLEFDDVVTGPIHGFTGADDYYTRCSSKQFLHQIRIPTLLIQAKDDPFLSEESYPYAIAQASKYLHFLPSTYGGHVGFTTFGSSMYWNEKKLIDFIHENTGHIDMCSTIAE